MDPYWTFLRAANVPLLIIASLVLFVRFNDAWRRVTPGWKLIRLGAIVLFGGSVVASAVRYALSAPVDGFVLVGTGSSVLVIAGGWLTRHEDPAPRP